METAQTHPESHRIAEPFRRQDNHPLGERADRNVMHDRSHLEIFQKMAQAAATCLQFGCEAVPWLAGLIQINVRTGPLLESVDAS
jgi:hypothetical protein